MIRNSEVQAYKECRLKWHWAYVKRREAIQPNAKLALGTLMHKVFELWYVPGMARGAKHPKDLVRKAHELCVQAGEYPDGILHAPVSGSKGDEILIEDLVVHMMENYFQEYGYDDHLEVLVPEINFQVEVYDKHDRHVGIAVGQIDLTVFDHDRKRAGFLEHKSSADLEPFGAPTNLDEQSGMYWTYGPIYLEHLGLIESGDDVTFLQFNRVRKAIRDDDRPEDDQGRKLNKDGTVSKRQPAPLLKREDVYRTPEMRSSLDRRFQMVAREMQKVRDRKLPVYKSPGKYCNWCEFRDACDVHEIGEDYRDTLKLTTKRWDPYEAHTGGKVVKA